MNNKTDMPESENGTHSHSDVTPEDKKRHGATLEAILFVHGSPISYSRIAEVLGVSRNHAVEIVEYLADDYNTRESGLQVIVHDQTVQMVTHKAHAHVIEGFIKKQLEGNLSQAALEVLAVVAYRGPLSKPDIEAIRGVNCSFTLRNLSLRGLIERAPHPTDSRTQLYRVTMDFVRHVGVESLQDLPHFDQLISDRRIDAVLYGEQLEDAPKAPPSPTQGTQD